MSVPRKTVKLHLYIDGFDVYVDDFLVLPIAEEQDILLGMPWLKATNPDINWIEETVNPRPSGNVVVNPSLKLSTKKKKAKPHTTHNPKSAGLFVGGQRFSVNGNLSKTKR
ncbi:hypothetical protein F441_14621 [Phytophthora nicotianae CJ01A1]|uniref:Uncharacterized protein n=2 Tax=Phytophthora nicotianae TaxID=4792 RepID=W2WG84_PHYNI|nr:hypothetical protein F444_14789 [Phytophthora nicotianae P1976]ETP09511.1 hypothetical protein F441_14621 [Phytophthora nicotianae CJ01A1]